MGRYEGLCVGGPLDGTNAANPTHVFKAPERKGPLTVSSNAINEPMMVEETVYQLREITMGDQSGDRKIWTPSGESAAKAFDKISRVYQAVKGYMPPDYIQRSAAMKDFPNRSRQMVLGANELAYSLFEEIKHGDAKHQEWLEEALFCWFNGQPVPKLEKS